MDIRSPAFSDKGRIPTEYTCDGADTSPPLSFFAVPAKASSLALVVEDPDAPSGLWVHWLVWNINPATESIGAGDKFSGAVEGVTSAGTRGYHGPCPPSGVHRYFFRLFALDTELDLAQYSAAAEFMQAAKGHILAQAEFFGIYSRN